MPTPSSTPTDTGSAPPAEGRAAAATPQGPTPAGQTPNVAEVHAHDAPPPTTRPVAAGARRRLRLAAGWPASCRPGRRRPSQPLSGGHRRHIDHCRPACPAAPGGAAPPRPDTALADLTAILNTNVNTILTRNLTTATALTGTLNRTLTGGSAGGRVRARPARQTLPAGYRRPRRLRLLRTGLAGLAARRPELGAHDRRRPMAMALPARHDVPATKVGPGDLLFYAHNPHDPASIHHVAMAVDHARMVEAPEPDVPVRVRPLRWRGLYAAARPP